MADYSYNSFLIAVNDSVSSHATIDFLCKLPISPVQVHITLLHILRKPIAGDELMGKKYMEKQPDRLMVILKKFKSKLIEHGFLSDKIDTKLISDDYQTVGDGIIDQYKKGNYGMVIIGRKRMSKAEEFVLGDPSVKLIRSLEKTAVLVVKST